ncbi:hypothetical protein JTE90_003365 [Oedothorax gibbosus]|uniref:MULE transposase domain-containing protein n=1 Tax=Oedothorax gibbosus TaxID=931172 RepID=A0AAV6TYH6_9ARAC|nr:hypothetical protein JTE90_003365 [Oedothorax gibbosus]
MANLMKSKIKKGEELAGQIVYRYNLPDQERHKNHVCGAAAACTEAIDPQLKVKIKELVFQGQRNLAVIATILEQYVVGELGETDRMRNRFFPIKTNVGYQPVAVIITQYETKEAILEALIVVKEWNPEIVPKFGMVDFAMEEILALELAFSGIKVFICTFHREQAWTRWTSKAVNISEPRAEALEKLRAIGNASNFQELEGAIENLQKWDYYEGSPLKLYFERTWLPEIERWTLVNKPPGLLFHTNNGVERINEELKYRYLMENKNCSLSGVMNVVVTEFLPDHYKLYITKNVKMLNLH